MGEVSEGSLLWRPTAERIRATRLSHYLDWLGRPGDAPEERYARAWNWSADRIEEFWASLWDYFPIRASSGYRQVLSSRTMPGSSWFAGAELNYAEHALARTDEAPALLFRREDGLAGTTTFRELRAQVAALAAGLAGLGVRRGDRVAALLPNCPQAVVGLLATASLGAVWSSCSPEFGARSVLDRFAQIQPTVLLAVNGYQYNGRSFDVTATVRELSEQLPGLRATVLLRYVDGPDEVAGARDWAELADQTGDDLRFEAVPFEHPLWILYSSGTTGLPKAIVHGHGGILLEHLKSLALHMDLGPADRFFWFSTTGWMMWNLLVSGLLVGSALVLYDGSPAYPDPDAMWRLAAETAITYFGTSAPYLHGCLKGGLRPATAYDLSALHSVGSTGAPLSPEGFAWVYHEVGEDLLLGSLSGGTDVCTGFVGSVPLLPVRAGELQGRMLGARVEAFDPDGRSLVDQVGELVVTAPMPSMPIRLWNDPDGARLVDSYFAMYPGVWRHGDWIRITPRGSCVIYGRSDSTLNRGGVRMGTSEFYRVVEEFPEIADSLVVDTGGLSGDGALLLFVVPAAGSVVDDALVARLRAQLRASLSPRHVPDAVHQVAEIPRTLNGKKCEVPVKRILLGAPIEQAVSEGALANPGALAPFLQLARDSVEPA